MSSEEAINEMYFLDLRVKIGNLILNRYRVFCVISFLAIHVKSYAVYLQDILQE